MIFTETPLAGAYLVDVERRDDERGFFARAFCSREFVARGLSPVVAQVNVAMTRLAGTVRGLHFQVPPASEAKLVRVTRGAVADVIVDLRPESPTWLRCYVTELQAAAHRSLYVPERFAHGYQTLVDETEIVYQTSEAYNPQCERGLRPDDPAVNVPWPRPVGVISERDRTAALLETWVAQLRREMAVFVPSHATGHVR